MKKLKRSARLVDMTQYLLIRPHSLIPLTTFAERYQSAKSSISEDLVIIKDVFHEEGMGELITVAGAAGGVKFIPQLDAARATRQINYICNELSHPDRLLPGGYLYMSDILGQPALLNDIGKMFATAFAYCELDVVMTVETKGIALAYATAAHLNLPVVVVKRDNQVTEGSAVSINYISGSTKRIQTMSLSRRAMREASRVLIIDDFMKAGGTVQGMINLLSEFNAKVQGVGIFVESADSEEHLVDEYISLVRLTGADYRTKKSTVLPGTYFDQG